MNAKREEKAKTTDTMVITHNIKLIITCHPLRLVSCSLLKATANDGISVINANIKYKISLMAEETIPKMRRKRTAHQYSDLEALPLKVAYL
jgi:hypothetical protein